jgi:hypothetical protein
MAGIPEMAGISENSRKVAGISVDGWNPREFQ